MTTILVAGLCACGPSGTAPVGPSEAPSLDASPSATCTAPAWDPASTYARGDLVSHLGHDWRAKKNHQGVEPGSHPAYWSDRGTCEGDTGDPPPPPPPPPTGPWMQIFGVWHAGDHFADWRAPRDMVEFDQANRWIIDRGDGRPSVNLVVLSFLQPLEVLDLTNDPVTVDGVPIGMTREIVDYFKDAGVRVMMSIGGITYTDFWNEALATDATRLGLNAAAIASRFGVGIEIDYEENRDPDLAGLDAFVAAYRSVHPYDPSGLEHAARLTIDLAAGGRYLQDLNRHATQHWLDNAAPVLDYANAMVARDSGDPADWQEHVDGKPQYGPPIPPKAPNRFTGGLYLNGDNPNCLDLQTSEQWEHAEYVRTVAPGGAGTTAGMLGYMFWAAETPSARKNYVPTTPPNSCEGGMGEAATVFEIPIPMPPLRQH
ncbi:MAG: hypothetical protein R3195_08995 [Gemmatimonadota bacterium]|nr:hypothetical protein [Gemmatimonadota bacterium]